MQGKHTWSLIARTQSISMDDKGKIRWAWKRIAVLLRYIATIKAKQVTNKN